MLGLRVSREVVAAARPAQGLMSRTNNIARKTGPTRRSLLEGLRNSGAQPAQADRASKALHGSADLQVTSDEETPMFWFKKEGKPCARVRDKLLSRARYVSLAALVVLALAVSASRAMADTTLTYHADGTSTMVTKNGDGFDHVTDFDRNGNVTRMTWLEVPNRKIVEYDALGRVRRQTVDEGNPVGGVTRTIRTNIYFPGGIVRYWIQVLQLDRNGHAVRRNDEVFWGGLGGPAGNAAPCPPPQKKR
jgi:hypothetical protein